MKTLTNYIVFHNQESLDLFQNKNNDLKLSEFNYIGVGDINSLIFNHGTINPYKNLYLANKYDSNIENIPSLLTFTAWYLIAKNNICKTEFVGIFEYDVKFNKPGAIELDYNTIYGINKRPLPDSMFLKSLPLLNSLMQFDERKIKYWNSTSNFIMPMEFLKKFVDWYMELVPQILHEHNHPHYHERAVNIFAANNGYNNETIEGIEHLQLNSHGINL